MSVHIHVCVCVYLSHIAYVCILLMKLGFPHVSMNAESKVLLCLRTRN